MATLEALKEGATFAGDYRVVRRLAEGGMGAVYVVEQLSTSKPRALKVMHPDLAPDEKSRRRFVEEAKIGGRIESDHVVDVLTAGVDDASGTPYIVMELLEGATLEDHIRTHGSLSPPEALDLLEQAGHALGRAHAAGIVHADLKPENLFLARAKQKGVEHVVKVLDFGIARVIEAGRRGATVTSAIGTPLYMAPEQAQTGAKLGPPTDVWALGLIAFYLLTARSYWLAANHPEMNLSALLVEILQAPIVPASQRARELRARAIPSAFDAWLGRCLEREPERRFPDASAAIAALKTALEAPGIPIARTEPIDAATPPRPEPAPPPVAPPGEAKVPTPVLAGGAIAIAIASVAGLWAINQDWGDDEPDEPPPVVDAPTPAAPTRSADADRSPTVAPRDVAGPGPDAQRTSSGLASRVVEPGTGAVHPTAQSRVRVHYTGWTTDGRQFDSSYDRGQPATFGLNQVIPGWTEGVQLMVEGERRLLFVPEDLAYRGRPGAPAGMLVFDVRLLEILPPG